MINGFGYFILAVLMLVSLIKVTNWSLRRKSPPKVHNVKDFGAKGDGLADDTEAIKAAMKAMAEYGGLVFFPKGQYLYSDEELNLASASPGIQVLPVLQGEPEGLDIEVELENEVETAVEADQKPESD